MIFQLSATLLAGCAVQAVADAPAAVVDAVDVSPPTTKDLLSAPTNNDNVNRRQHRLLKKFKKRKERRLNAQTPADAPSAAADTGVLSTKTPRFLEETDYDYFCPRETCPAELCDCADSGGSLEDCTDELQRVCQARQLNGCVFKDYVHVYEEVYCPFVNCVGEGFRESQCDCAFYELYCERLHSNECAGREDDPDKKPFFGCDEREMAGVCSEAKSCKGKGELQGLPELGTWQGAEQIGIKKNSGERMGVGRASAVAGVALLSTLWFMVNA